MPLWFRESEWYDGGGFSWSAYQYVVHAWCQSESGAFTSTQPGEGKSFIAGNTAVSLAYMGKKVVIVGLDIRKPGLNKVFNLSHRTEGITNYLADPEHTNLLI